MKRIPCFSFFKIIFVLFFVIITNLSSQQFAISEIDTTNFPILSCNFFARDAAGNSYTNLTNYNFSITDLIQNINKSKININCVNTLLNPAVNIVLVIDRSGSMEDIDSISGKLKWQLVKDGVESFLNSIRFTNGTKIGLVTFDGLSMIACRFTDDKKEIADSLHNQNLYGSTNYNPPFLDYSTGAIQFLVNQNPINQRRRVIVFLTDNNPSSSKPTIVDSIKAECVKQSIQVYGITLNIPMNIDLDTICKATGGLSQAVYTEYDLNNTFEYFAMDIQKSMNCTLSWESPYGCSDLSKNRTVDVNFTKNTYNKSILKNYKAPDKSVAKLKLSESILSFDSPAPGEIVFKELVITAENQPFILSSYQISPNRNFSIIDWDVLDEYSIKRPPLTIDIGESRTIRVKYKSNKYFKQAKLFLMGAPCPCSIMLSGY